MANSELFSQGKKQKGTNSEVNLISNTAPVLTSTIFLEVCRKKKFLVCYQRGSYPDDGIS